MDEGKNGRVRSDGQCKSQDSCKCESGCLPKTATCMVDVPPCIFHQSPAPDITRLVFHESSIAESDRIATRCGHFFVKCEFRLQIAFDPAATNQLEDQSTHESTPIGQVRGPLPPTTASTFPPETRSLSVPCQ